MNKRIKILHLEDSLNDFELIHSIIENGGIEHDYFLTDSEKGYINILETEMIDIILSDYSLPDYNGNEALKFAKEKHSPIPFIFVSGAIGEDAAITAMLSGATDYVLKNKLDRLVPAIKRALHENELKLLNFLAEEELKKSQLLLNEAQKLSHIGVWNWEADTDCVTWTKELYRIAGLDPNLPAPTYGEQSAIYTPESWLLLQTAVAKATKTHESYELELDLIRPDGEIRYVIAFGGAILDNNNDLTGLYGTVQDVTERKLTEQKLIIANNVLASQNKEIEKRAGELKIASRKLEKNERKILAFNSKLEQRISERTKQVEAATKAKSDFLSSMSHEIRTPMNAVLGYADLLCRQNLDKTQMEYVESIQASGKSLLVLINSILDLSKIEAGKLELQYAFVNTRVFFSDFERVFSIRLAEKRLKFILDISSETPAGIYIDDARMSQVILNLLGNAIKFTEGGSIRLQVYTEKTRAGNSSGEKAVELTDLIIKVTDTGIGISRKMKNEIFKPFIQAKGQNVKKYGGTGLGLTITKRLIELMNGSVRVDSELNHGSTFTIKIPGVPVLTDFDIRKDITEFDPSEIEFDKAVILIADDIENNRKYLRDALKNSGLIIIEAENGKEALSLAKKHIPDLIIADISMPVLDGYELLNKLQTIKVLNHIPVIAYSASVMKEQQDRILKSKFAGLLIKPVKVIELYNELKKILKYTIIKTSAAGPVENEKSHQHEISDLPGLIYSLDNQLKDICTTFEIIQPIDEIRDFGNKLAAIGAKHNSEIIKNYGKELLAAAASFNIEAILKLIRKYTDVIGSIKEPVYE